MMRLRDIMTTDVITVTPELSLRDAMALFSSKHLSGAPVVASGHVVGVVSSTDLMEFAASLPGLPVRHEQPDDVEPWPAATDWTSEESETPQAFFAHSWDDSGAVAERIHEAGSPEWTTLAEHTVSEVMTRTIFSLPPGTAVEFAAWRMREVGVHRVLVMQGDALAGIVSTTDIANAVADRRLAASRFRLLADRTDQLARSPRVMHQASSVQ